jgi:subtilisin-like proprotein convertase family protein
MTISRPVVSVRRTRRRLGALAVIASLGIGAAITGSAPRAAAEVETSFTGPGVTIPGSGTIGRASVYPSEIEVENVGRIVSVRVVLTELVHSWASDLNIVLEAPDGRAVLLMAGCRGGNGQGSSAADRVDGTLTFADDGVVLADAMAGVTLGTGTYAPSRCEEPRMGETTLCPCEESFAALAGGDPNGTWSLHVYDDASSDTGSLAEWTLVLNTRDPVVAGDGSFSGPRDADVRDTLVGLVSDADDDPLAFAVASAPTNGMAFVARDGTFRYRPDDGFVGVDTFTYRVEDDLTASEGEVTITVTDIADTGDPTVTITSPTAGRYLQGAAVTAAYACTDTASGVAACTGTVADGAPIDTSRPGTHSFRVTARDRAGNDHTATVAYTVVTRPTCDGKPATIVGTAGVDVITGTPRADVIVTGDGRDWITAGPGNDTICTGAGRDVIRSGTGNDTVNAGTSRDILLGGVGHDTLKAGTGGDILVGGPGNDTLVGADGNDTVLGAGGNDHLAGGRGTDSCRGGTGTDRGTSCEQSAGIP